MKGRLVHGQRLGRYQLMRGIGVGGMAELYLARAPTGISGFERVVALKRILPQLSADAEFVDLFESEARLAGLLRHPNIATLHEFVHADDELFFTMEYVHGADLSRILKRAAKAKRGFKLSHALSIVTRVAAGLHHAHEQRNAAGDNLGIVHRDVSPTNIVVGYDGSVKIIDFGIAKALTRRIATRTGDVRGKVAYLSPEQAMGEPLDRRSDIFSLAIVLHELTTGRRMFKNMDDFAILYQLAHQAMLAPSAIRDDYDPALESIVMRGLSRHPDERYPSAQAFQEALEDYARDSKISLSSVGVGRFMHELFGEVPDPTHEQIDDAAVSQPPANGSAVQDALEMTTPHVATAEDGPEMTAAPLSSNVVASFPARRRSVYLGVAAAVTLSVALTGAFYRGGTAGDESEQAADTADAVPSSADTAPPSAPSASTPYTAGSAPAPSLPTNTAAGEPPTAGASAPHPSPTAESDPPAASPRKGAQPWPRRGHAQPASTSARAASATAQPSAIDTPSPQPTSGKADGGYWQ